MESILQKRGTRLTLLVLVGAGAIYGAYQLSAIFAPLLFSFIIAYVLDPVADALERRKFTRLAAVITIFLVGAGVAFGFFAVSGVYVYRGVEKLVQDVKGEKPYPADLKDSRLKDIPNDPEGRKFYDENENGKHDPGLLKEAEIFLTGWIKGPKDQDPTKEERQSFLYPYDVGALEWVKKKQKQANEVDPKEIKKWVGERLDSAFENPAKLLFGDDRSTGGTSIVVTPAEKEKSGPGIFGRVFTWFSWLLLCPLYIFYLLLEIDPLIEKMRRLLPGKQRPRIERILGQVDSTMAAFFRGRLTICVVKGVGTSIGLLILGVPFALPLGLAAGFLALIPYVGIWFAIIPSLILAWLDSSGSFGYILGVAAVFIVMEVLEGFVMIPKFLGKEVGLHPLTVIVTMLIFAQLLGFLGVLLSVPLAAITKILLEEFVMPLVEEFAAETPDEKKAEPSG